MAAADEAMSMFAGAPQPVEIHHRGIWYSGELIGWRHEAGGRVAGRVRCRVDGLRHSAWVDLTRLRLPDPRHPPHKEAFPAVVQRLAGEEDATRPHLLLPGMRTRPSKPAHALTPPTAPTTAPPSPGNGEPVAPPRRHEPAAAWRRNDEPHWRKAYLSVV